MIKSYTDLEQSKKLAEILPIESADMYYEKGIGDNYRIDFGNYADMSISKNLLHIDAIPCWSLSALLNILAKIASEIDDDGSANLSSFMGQWSVNMFDCPIEATDNYDNPVDACYNLIIKLHEKDLL